MEHFDDDKCAKYRPEFELRVVGYLNPVIADDVAVGDFLVHPASGDMVWVYDAHAQWSGGEVHLFFVDATPAEVTQAWLDACEGHETLAGAIGDTLYCDGGCVGKGRWPRS